MRYLFILLIFIACSKSDVNEYIGKEQQVETRMLFKPGYYTTCDSIYFRVREHLSIEVDNCNELKNKIRSRYDDSSIFRYLGVSYNKNEFIFCE